MEFYGSTISHFDNGKMGETSSFHDFAIVKRRRKILHSPKTCDKLNMYNLNYSPNNVKILNFGYLLLKGKLMQNVEL